MKSATRAIGVAGIFVLAAAAWVGASARIADPAAPPDASQTDRLIRQLGSNDFDEREAASDALLALGRPALKVLRKAAASSDDAEIRSRLEAVIRKIDADAIALRELGATVEVDADRPDEPVISVGMNTTRVPAGALDHLERFDSLVKLELLGQGFTDAGVAHLSGLKHLRELSLAQSAVTDDGLAALTGLKELEHLDLCGTKITGAGLKHLQGMDRLCILYLDRTAVNDDGLASLEGVRGLLALRLAHTKVTDAGLQHLKGMHDLRLLDLSHTAVTDAGLPALAGLHELQRLDVIGTEVTPKGLAELSKSLPKLDSP